jgi:hypothetical protein
MITVKCGTAADLSVIYVYGVAHAPCEPQRVPLRLEGVVPEASVHPLVHANLMAFVSAVPASQFGPSEFHSALNDAEWLKARILAHERVVEDLRSSCNVVSFRFGTVYLDSNRALNALACHRAELCQALDRIRGASEWGMKVYCDHDKLERQIETESASIRQMRGMLGRASPGARFFLQKKYAFALDSESAATVAGCVRQIRDGLDSCAGESMEIDLQPAVVHGRSADMVMNAAYLVPEKSLGRFRQALTAMRDEFAAHGFDYELTGPWPPYHFVSVRQEGTGDGAASDQ